MAACGRHWPLSFILFSIQYLTLAGIVEGLSYLLYAHTQHATAAAAENWFYFVEKARPGGSSL